MDTTYTYVRGMPQRSADSVAALIRNPSLGIHAERNETRTEQATGTFKVDHWLEIQAGDANTLEYAVCLAAALCPLNH